MNYSTGGSGTIPHLAAELFKKTTGTNIVHVPYKGGGPALTGVIAGEVQMTFDPVATSLPLIKDGKLRALAIAGPKRVAALPDVPTMAESGYASFTVGAWTALLAPKGTPAAIIAKLNAAVNKALQLRADEKHPRAAGRAAARRHAQGARRFHGERNQEVEADCRGAQFEGELIGLPVLAASGILRLAMLPQRWELWP